MRFKQYFRYSNRLVALLALVLLSSGCYEEMRTKRSSKSSMMGETMGQIAEFETSEFNQAYATCLAFKSKSALFKGELKGQKFSFELDHTNCTGSPAVTTFKTTLTENADGSLSYADGPVNSYFESVETHLHGLIAPICTTVLKGNNTANTYTSSDKTVQVRFAESDGVPKVFAYTSAPSLEGGGTITREDILTISLGEGSQGAIVGLEIEREQRVPCPGGGVEILRQTYLNHNIY